MKTLCTSLAFSLAAGVLAVPASSRAQQGDGTRVRIDSHIFKPAKVEATPARIAQLKAPPGFEVSVFAAGLKNSRVIAVAPDGTVYVSRRDQGDVLMLADRNGDGHADAPPVTVANRSGTHGLAIHDGKLYLETVKEVFSAPILDDGRLGPLEMLIGDLPDAGQHANRTLAFGPDGMLYLSVGSTCNDCNESNPENATLLRATPDGKSRTIFASGLRNMIGFDWNPVTGQLWGLDNGIDFLGDLDQPEELNLVEKGKQYGWPHVYGDGKLYPQSTPVGEITKEQWRQMSTPMALGYAAHAAPMQLVFYRSSAFPAEYRNDAFATMRGSWNRDPAAGYEIVRIHFDASGKPASIKPFLTGFLTDGGMTHIARPMGLAVARDGSLLMADDANGVIYRIAYKGAKADGRVASAPAKEMETEAARGTGVPLTLERAETALSSSSANRLQPSSSTIPAGGDIPLKHSDYADGVSPPLDWPAVPHARSYAVIVEDPDSKPITPFVHWVAFNIPPTVTHLPEGLQEQLRLTQPEGVLQGNTSRGSAGYFGPHPPVGDPAHHYHFQVLALDSLLDLQPGADRDQVLAAARGHVIAKGEFVGLYAQKERPLK